MSNKVNLGSINVISDDLNIPFVDSDDQQQENNGFNQKRKRSLAERRNTNLSIQIQIEPPNSITNNSNKSVNKVQDHDDDGACTDSPRPLVNVTGTGTGANNLRRNSISLPAGLNKLDLDALQQIAHRGGDSTSITDCVTTDDADSITCSIPDVKTPDSRCNDDDDDDDDEPASKKPIFKPKFRSKRRLSIAPLPALRLNDKEMMANEFDNQSVLSNQNSITSVNSLASLLKEKMQAFPSMIRKKKKETKDYKIKVFVAILFFIIVFLVGYAYITYHQQILTRSYFEKVKFNKIERFIRVFNNNGEEILTGHIGTTVMSDTPFHCLLNDTLDDGSVCLEWNGRARLYMNSQDKEFLRCYTIKWQSLDEGVYPTDCYDLPDEDSYWFGGGLTKNADYPLNEANFDFAPFISGDAKIHQFGNAIKRYFINSLGVAIQVDEETPLQISVNKTAKKFCLRGRHDDFAFVNRLTPHPILSYKICTADDMRSLHRLMTQQSLWDGLKEDDIKALHTLIEEPVWHIPAKNYTMLNEDKVYNYSEDVIAMGFMRLGHILVNELWQENIGDFSIDQERFPDFKSTINVLHRRGFKIVLTVQPFISTDSLNFKDAVKKKLLIYERHSERSIPALTRYKTSTSAGVLDITNNASIPWLVDKLNKVIKEYQIDLFYLDLGTAYNIPHYYQCHKTLDNPDVYGKLLLSNLEDSIRFIGVSSAIIVPRPPTFLSLPPVASSWDGLRSLVIAVLTYGILGYPFIIPGPVGGDYFLPNKATKMLSFYSVEQPPLPSQELYIRWLQLVTFLPSIQFSHLPSAYKSDDVTEIAKELTAIRLKTVIPLMKKYLSESMNEGLPLVRPLWLLDPKDPACLSVSDEFSIGEELIVAPILQTGHVSREVYLPQGVWKDGIDGSLRKGSRWIHNYRVPQDKVAYFVKMPDNTRF